MAGIPIDIPVIAPKGSTIVVRTYQDSVLISTDTLVTEKRKTDLQIIPVPGTSEVELELTDKEGNIHRNRLLVVGSKAVDLASQETLEQMPGDEQPIIPSELILEDPVGIMLLDMQRSSDGTLQDFLMELDPEQEKIESQKELISYLYDQADTHGYAPVDVDLLLAETMAGGDAELLLQQLIEQSDGPLKAYLNLLDLEAEGIYTSQDLLNHLERVTDTEDFSMDDVRKAMLESLERPLEVYRLYEELLHTSEGTVKEILETMDLRGNEVHTIDQFIDLLSGELAIRGMSKKEIEQVLSELLGDQYSGSDFAKRKAAWPLLVLIAVAGLGLAWFIIAWWRRREKGEKQEE